MLPYLKSCRLYLHGSTKVLLADGCVAITFPQAYFDLDSQQCDKANKHENIRTEFERTKKMAAHIEKALKIVKDCEGNESTYSKSNSSANDDLSHFDQLVIKKKNPYVDLNELELRYYNPKNMRQSLESGLNGDQSLCEPLEEGPNVEITNRGLTGFAIPTTLLKGVNLAKNKIQLQDNPTDSMNIKTKASQENYEKLEDLHLLEALEDEVVEFQNRKANRIIN